MSFRYQLSNLFFASSKIRIFFFLDLSFRNQFSNFKPRLFGFFEKIWIFFFLSTYVSYIFIKNVLYLVNFSTFWIHNTFQIVGLFFSVINITPKASIAKGQ